MEPKRTKYDTNPLDDKVGERARESFSSPTEEVRRDTTRDIDAEAPTRRIDDKMTSYPSVFVPPQPREAPTYQPPRMSSAEIYQPPPTAPPNIYQPPPMPVIFKPGLNKVAGLGIPERWASLLPYIPGYIGAVAAVIELLLVPRMETRTRFHASQGLALQITILILSGAFGLFSLISGSSFGGGMFRFAAFVFLIVSMIRAFKGRPHHIAPLDSPRQWLEEKIKPKK
ncbi:MAG TPA: hypothetical protein VI282_10990 [Verrucomicrobiae bacterium]